MRRLHAACVNNVAEIGLVLLLPVLTQGKKDKLELN